MDENLTLYFFGYYKKLNFLFYPKWSLFIYIYSQSHYYYINISEHKINTVIIRHCHVHVHMSLSYHYDIINWVPKLKTYKVH